MQVRLTDDQVELMAAGYLGGLTLNELASAFGADRRTLAGWLEQRGVPRRGRRLTPTDIDEATRLYLDGWSLAPSTPTASPIPTTRSTTVPWHVTAARQTCRSAL
jgi:hypothetical protein